MPGLGVDAGGERNCAFSTFVLIGSAEASRTRSWVVFTVTMFSSIDPDRILFCCSAKLAHAMNSQY